MGLFDKLKNLTNGGGNKGKEDKQNKAKKQPEEKEGKSSSGFVKWLNEEEKIKEQPKAEKPKSVTEDSNLNQDNEETVIMQEQEEKVSFELKTDKPKRTSSEQPLDESQFEEAKNIVELQEISIPQIAKKLSSLSYANVKLQKLVFHFRENRGNVASIQGEQLFKSERFLRQLKAKLEDREISFVKNVQVEIIFSSEQIDDFTPITNQVSVEVLTPNDILVHKKAKITALSGKTIEEEYIITSREKPYLIGRGKTPKLPTSRMIKNDIAFVEPKEGDNDEIQLNRHVSRSILLIRFNPETNQFEVGRTAYMFNPNHIVKINRLTGQGGQEEIKLNTDKINVPLCDDDQIIINNKINILFELMDK